MKVASQKCEWRVVLPVSFLLFLADSLYDFGTNKVETCFCILERIVARFRVLNMDLKVISGQSLQRIAIPLETLRVWVELFSQLGVGADFVSNQPSSSINSRVSKTFWGFPPPRPTHHASVNDPGMDQPQHFKVVLQTLSNDDRVLVNEVQKPTPCFFKSIFCIIQRCDTTIHPQQVKQNKVSCEKRREGGR